MTIQTTYSRARAGLAKLLDRVTLDHDIVVIQRRGREDVALISVSDLNSLTETVYLLRSPKNAERLLTALGRALNNEGITQNLDDLRRAVGLHEENT